MDLKVDPHIRNWKFREPNLGYELSSCFNYLEEEVVGA